MVVAAAWSALQQADWFSAQSLSCTGISAIVPCVDVMRRCIATGKGFAKSEPSLLFPISLRDLGRLRDVLVPAKIRKTTPGPVIEIVVVAITRQCPESPGRRAWLFPGVQCGPLRCLELIASPPPMSKAHGGGAQQIFWKSYEERLGLPKTCCLLAWPWNSKSLHIFPTQDPEVQSWSANYPPSMSQSFVGTNSLVPAVTQPPRQHYEAHSPLSTRWQ